MDVLTHVVILYERLQLCGSYQFYSHILQIFATDYKFTNNARTYVTYLYMNNRLCLRNQKKRNFGHLKKKI